MNSFSPWIVIAGILALMPYLALAFLPRRTAGAVQRLPRWLRIGAPVLLSVPYVLVSIGVGTFSWGWFGLYALLPAAIAALLDRPERGEGGRAFLAPDFLLLDFAILALLGLAVDLRWFERAWPPHLAIFNKVVLLDAGIYAFGAVRNLRGVGFDLRLRATDVRNGLREFLLYLPIALTLGLALGFIHLHRFEFEGGRVLGRFALAWVFTFFFIAVPEELFFRGWLQNLLERRIGRSGALAVTAVLFGLSHFNKRTAFFNWQYVVLAALAGVFYGRAWRRERCVGASVVTHATVDSVWSLWFH